MAGSGTRAEALEQSGVADAPYAASDLVLNPGVGAGAGFVGAALMLVAVVAMRPSSAPALPDILRRIGTMVLGAGALHGEAGMVAGVIIQGGLGAVLGLLYALCQQRAPLWGLLWVGVFYGIVLWVASGILSNLPFWAGVRPLAHTRIWLLACCIYGIVLALAAGAAGRRQAGPARAEAPE